jgi:fatty-acyl-CoA synthase
VTGQARDGAIYADLIVEALSRYPEREAFRWDGGAMTYAEAADLTSRLTQLLASRGVGRGDGVAALGPNRPELFLVQAAAYLLGARFTGMNALGSALEHSRLAQDADISLLLVDAAFAETGAQIAAAAGIGTLLTLGPASAGEQLDDALAGFQARALDRGPAQPDDVAWLQYTGGTTGVSKGVMLTQSAMAQQVQSWLCSYGLPQTPRYLAAAPITHAAVLALLPTLIRGGTVVLQPGFQPDAFLACIERDKINYAFGVPTMIYALLDHDGLSRYDLSSLRTFAYGAAPISPSRLAQAVEAFGPVMLQGYAQTECLAIMTLDSEEHEPEQRPDLMSSCGRPVVGAVVALLDEQGEPVLDGAVGEICVRSRAVMAGYWKQPALTAEALAGGWLHTGDMAVRDDAGFFHIVDRKKDMIISGGFNVFSREVEDVLAAHPSVSAAAVVGLPDERWGERVTAYVVARPGATVDPDVLIGLVRQEKGPHYAPKSVHLVDRLPTTAVGKIDKKVLRMAVPGQDGPSARPAGGTHA